MNCALPDVNVLLALAWPNHQFHAPARHWFERQEQTWHTCAVTQLGFVRLSANPAFTRHAKTPHEATLLLAAMTAHPGHRFVAEPVPAAGDAFVAVAPRLQGHQQVTDAYLVALSHAHGFELVTFDPRLEVVSPFAGVVRLLT